MEDYQEAMLKSLVAVAWADGRLEGQETEIIEALLSSFEIKGEDADTIREYAKTPRSIDEIPLSDLSAADRRVLVQHAVILSYIDGTQSEKEKQVIDELVAKLRIPSDEATELLASAGERARRLISLL